MNTVYSLSPASSRSDLLSLLPVRAQRPFTLVPRAQIPLYRLWFTPSLKSAAFPGMFHGFLAFFEDSRKRMSCHLPILCASCLFPTSEMVPHGASVASASPPLRRQSSGQGGLCPFGAARPQRAFSVRSGTGGRMLPQGAMSGFLGPAVFGGLSRGGIP